MIDQNKILIEFQIQKLKPKFDILPKQNNLFYYAARSGGGIIRPADLFICFSPKCDPRDTNNESMWPANKNSFTPLCWIHQYYYVAIPNFVGPEIKRIKINIPILLQTQSLLSLEQIMKPITFNMAIPLPSRSLIFIIIKQTYHQQNHTKPNPAFIFICTSIILLVAAFRFY